MLLAGCCKVDITPPVGTPIGGNVREDNISRGVHDPLFANLLYLRDNDSEVLFIGLDLIGVHRELAGQIKGEIQRKLGIPQKSIAIFATHTHSGPDVIEAFKDHFHPLVEIYLEELKEKVVEGVVKCTKNTWKAKIGAGKTLEHSLSFNRRIMMKNGSIRMNWETLDFNMIDSPAGPIDPDLYVISILDDKNRTRSILVNFTLHPAVLVGKDWLFSRDFIDPLTRRLEDEFDQDLVVIFANGALGNINHIDLNNLNQTRGFEETERIGVKLAEKVLQILPEIQYTQKTCFHSISERIELPRRIITREQLEKAERLLEKVNGRIPSLLDGVPEEAYAKEIIALYREKGEYVKTELQIIQWNDVAIVCLPGEFFVEFGLEIKNCSPFLNTLIVGLANDYIGYVPTEKAFEEGGYEIKTARTSKLQPQSGQLVVTRVRQMLKQLQGGDR